MEVFKLVFSVFWTLITLIVSGFILWRKLRSERIDFEDLVIDRAILAAVIGVVGGRLVYVLTHLSSFGWEIGKWLSISTSPGIVDVVSLVLGLVAFWLLLGSNWKDPVEIMDYASIGLSFFLFLVALGQLLFSVVSAISLGVSQSAAAVVPSLDIRFLAVSLVETICYLLLFIFLSRVEKNYRTFLWYRAKRRSASTGFVLASLLIAYGLIGITLGWFLSVSIVVAGVSLDPILKLLVGLSGIVILYVRSGRALK